jgi:hypothetical protein
MILAQARDRWAEEGVLMFWAVINSLQSELDRLKDPGPKDETGRGKTVEERLICRTGGERVLMNYRQILGLFIGKKTGGTRRRPWITSRRRLETARRRSIHCT